MNKTVRDALIFLTGAVVGAGSMWLGVNKFYKKQAAEEIDKMNEYIEKHYRKKYATSEPTERSKEVAEKAHDLGRSEKIMLESYKETIPEHKVAYNAISDKPAEKEVKTLETGNIVRPAREPGEDMPEEDKHREPYFITLEEYGDIEPYYDKVTLLYDKEDSSLIDAQTNEIVDISDSIGLTVYEELDNIKDGAYVYVRNDSISTDFEVEVVYLEGEEIDET